MKNMTKRKFISFFLAMTMLFMALPLSPVGSFAIGDEEERLSADDETLDFSGDIGKHATLNIITGDETFIVMESEPTTNWQNENIILYSSDFSDDLVFKIDAYKVVTETYADGTVEQTLWYQVSVSFGTANEDCFADGYWILQNYLVGDVYEYDAMTLFVPKSSVSVTVDGEEVTEINVSKEQTITLTATPNVEGTTIYRWQMLIPTANIWVYVSGQTAANFTVNYGMVANRLDSDGKAHVRCVTTVNGQTIIGEPIAVNIVETMKVSSPLLKSSAPDVKETVTVTIEYVYGSDPSKLIAEPIQSTIQKGASYTLPGHVLPTLEGFSAYLGDDTETILTKYDIVLDKVNEDTTITFKYWPAKVNYTVIYYQQNVNNENYTEKERVTLTDFTGQMTTVEDKVYAGFYQLLYENVPIASDGSTVIKIYYDRYYYLMLFNLDGGYGVQPVYARHGTTLPIQAPKKAGCDFVGWDSDADNDSAADSNFPTTMPIGDSSYTAIWKFSKDKVDVHLVIWGENPNNEAYSYTGSTTIQVAPGTQFNYMEHTLTCTVEEHIHSAACGYSCGKNVHIHDESCNRTCEHTHGLGCYGTLTPHNLWNEDRQAIMNMTALESGYVYAIDAPPDKNTYYYLYLNGEWRGGGSAMIQGEMLGMGTYYEQSSGRTWTARKYKAATFYCKHTHGLGCYGTLIDHVISDIDLAAIQDIEAGKEPQSGYVYNIKSTGDTNNYYYLYLDGKWYKGNADLAEGEALGIGSSPSGDRVWTARKYKAAVRKCSHTHEGSCYGTQVLGSTVTGNDKTAIDNIAALESGYIYTINATGDGKTYYYLYYNNAWYQAHFDMIQGGVLGVGTYTNGDRTWTAAKFKSAYVACDHTHTIACYGNPRLGDSNVSEYDLGAINNIEGGPQSGYIYTIKATGDNRTFYYLYFNGHWYFSNYGMIRGEALGMGSYSASGRTWTAAKYKAAFANCNHTKHVDACYTCGIEGHVHGDACGYQCGKQFHRHSKGCYGDNLRDSKLWTLVKSDTVTVAPDGSTILNVYYDRTEFTLAFKYNYLDGVAQSTHNITDKWGASIAQEYKAFVNNIGTTFWTQNTDGKAGPFTNYFGTMPESNATYYNSGKNGAEGSMQYWGEDFNSGSYTVHLFTTPNVGGFTVTIEDRYEFEGFTYSHGPLTPEENNGIKTDCPGQIFYYTRNTYQLQFHDNGEKGIIGSLTKHVKYQDSLSQYAGITLDASDAPSKYEPGSVVFAGWYTNPEGAGEPFDFANAKMPAGPKNGDPSLILYAKWVPITHTVRFYTDKQYVGTETIYSYVDSQGETIQCVYEVPHGSKIQDPLIPPADPTKGQYQFNGWYYIDTQGNEQRWDFKNTIVSRDVDLYAKWSSNKLMPYTVNFVYVDENNRPIQIADPIIGSALGGNSKTFDAKGDKQLYAAYQEGYFPLVQSHTITIDLDNVQNNEFTFYYVKKDAVPYTVYYVTETPKAGDNLTRIELNGKTYYMVAETKEVADNRKAIVTETYKTVAGYLPKNYQETLIINPDATADNPNQIIFIYSVDEENSMYIVHYYFMDETGKKYIENPDYLFQSKAGIGSTVSAAILTVENFTYNPNAPGTVLEGQIVKDQIRHLHVYYDRNSYPYKVQYLEEGTLKVLAKEKIVTGSLWESWVTEKYITIPNYTLSSNPEVTIQIEKDTDNPTVNIITFYYTENIVTLNYEVVGPTGCGTVTPESESVKSSTGKANGSTAAPSSNLYKFVGWYSDEACTKRLSNDPKWVPTKANGDSWVDGTTYYAKFEYTLTKLTIQKQGWSSLDPNQTFIFNVKGNGVNLNVTVNGKNGWSTTIDGLTVGEQYTITEKTDWSWRYKCDSWTHTNGGSGKGNVATITLGLDGTITFTNSRPNNQWLDGDSWCDNLFGVITGKN